MCMDKKQKKQQKANIVNKNKCVHILNRITEEESANNINKFWDYSLSIYISCVRLKCIFLVY